MLSALRKQIHKGAEMQKKSQELQVASHWPFETNKSGLKGLAKVFEAEYSRISHLAVELDQLGPEEKLKKINMLEAWERLQVLDEIRRAH